MKCWFCESEARGARAACGRARCHQHAHIHDEFTIAKCDTSTRYTSYYTEVCGVPPRVALPRAR